MAFRPQFAYHVPPGWKEESCEFLWNNQYPVMSLPLTVWLEGVRRFPVGMN